jgi:hypothetical protein
MTMDFKLEGVPPEEMARLLEMVPQLAIPPSRLVGVVAVAQVSEAAGVTVEVLAIEVREAGALITWRARADRSVGILIPRVSITDDQNTDYRTFGDSGGGDGRSWSGEIALIPSPPRGVTLQIEIESLGANERMGMPGWMPNEPVSGPWRFKVPTRDLRERILPW